MRARTETIAMKLRPATKADLAAVENLLSVNDLPTEGVAENFTQFLVADDQGVIVGAIGLEKFGSTALLRSAVVANEHRGSGIGQRLVNELLERAAQNGLAQLYLLTTTAEDYFARFGFAPTTRSAVPHAVKASAEFRGACPDTATVMVRDTRDVKQAPDKTPVTRR
jgi:N-acetylglutamate synthase-like GNAT family acetyltransferase